MGQRDLEQVAVDEVAHEELDRVSRGVHVVLEAGEGLAAGVLHDDLVATLLEASDVGEGSRRRDAEQVRLFDGVARRVDRGTPVEQVNEGEKSGKEEADEQRHKSFDPGPGNKQADHDDGDVRAPEERDQNHERLALTDDDGGLARFVV